MNYLILFLTLTLLLPSAGSFAVADEQAQDSHHHMTMPDSSDHDCCDQNNGNTDKNCGNDTNCGKGTNCGNCSFGVAFSMVARKTLQQEPLLKLITLSAGELHASYALPLFRPPIA